MKTGIASQRQGRRTFLAGASAVAVAGTIGTPSLVLAQQHNWIGASAIPVRVKVVVASVMQPMAVYL